MRPSILNVIFLTCLIAYGAFATEVSGKIVFKSNLDRKTINAAVYDLRGIAAGPAPREPKGFSHTAVWLEAGRAENSLSPAHAVMQQLGRRFQPDVLIVPIGSTVEFPNLDPIFHNIFSLSRAQTFDLGYYAEGKSRRITFTRPGIIQVYCHIHANMYGVIIVTPSSWFGVPDSEGSFSFKGVPPGTYHLAIWQKSGGLFRKKLQVSDSAATHVQVTLPEDRSE